MKQLIKDVIYGVPQLLQLGRLSRVMIAPGGVVLTYHSFGEPDEGSLLPRVRAEQFISQLRYLQAHFSIVALRDLLDPAPETKRPRLAITVDDGFADNHSLLWPLLKAAGVPATIFVATDFVDQRRPPWPTQLADALDRTRLRQLRWPMPVPLNSREDRSRALLQLKAYLAPARPDQRFEALAQIRDELQVSRCGVVPMTWDQLREMHAGGVAIGSHTVFHSSLAHATQHEVEDELTNSKTRIETEIGGVCDLLAYPDGKWSGTVARIAQRVGYRLAVTQEPGPARPFASAFDVRRIEVPAHEHLPSFAARASLLLYHARHLLPG